MSKPYTEQDLSNIFDADLIWRRKELSDLKAAIKAADSIAQPVLLRSLITMSYAHWEGYVRLCANKYFEHLTLRRKPYTDFERQIYVNSYLNRLDAIYTSRLDITARCKLVNDILDGAGARFAYLHPDLIDTKSNLNTEVLRDICTICNVDWSHFENQKTFLDKLILKRRNAVAHGQQEFIGLQEVDNLVENILALMAHFRSLLENKVYTKMYAA